MGHSTTVKYINRENIESFFDALAVELINLTGPNGMVEIGVFGGSALIMKHNYRVATVDIDSFYTERAVPVAIDRVSKRLRIPYDWMNDGVSHTTSFSIRLRQRLIPFNTYRNKLIVYVVSDLDQLCMKLISGRDKDKQDAENLALTLGAQGFTLYQVQEAYQQIYGDWREISESKWRKVEKQLMAGARGKQPKVN